ncbi:MAG: futalosine hydrolase [Candidatus Electrothrix sp. MAN1_4]|nr:futalosine hydrolase [Candidatus Electrothrix sp. MAN1_4]
MNVLMTAATGLEMQAFLEAKKGKNFVHRLITGVGPVETTLSLTKMLQQQSAIDCVVNFGLAGAYLKNDTPIQAGLLDLCLAEQEVLGDLGIQLMDKVERFGNALQVQDRFVLDSGLLSAACQILEDEDIPYKEGIFVTVNCASGSLHRGNQLGRQFRGLCENMEGAAVARVCAEFSVPCLEIRCISNMVEDRNRENWRLQDACTKTGRVAAVLAAEFASACSL